MALNRSKLVQDQRKRTYDRISTLIDKGGKWLLHAQAIRERVSVAEMLRRAVLSRCGLRMIPYPEDLDALSKVQTAKEADALFLRIQRKEEADEIIYKVLQELSPEPDAAQFRMEVNYDTRAVLLRIAGLPDDEIIKILKQNREDETILINGYEAGQLRRLLANMKRTEIT